MSIRIPGSGQKRNGPFIFPPSRLEVAWLHIFSSANTPEDERQTSTALSSTVKARFPFSGTSSSRHRRTRAMDSLRTSSKAEDYHGRTVRPLSTTKYAPVHKRDS